MHAMYCSIKGAEDVNFCQISKVEGQVGYSGLLLKTFGGGGVVWEGIGSLGKG